MLEYRMTNMAPEEFQTLRYMLSNLVTLEAAIPATSAGLNVAVASVFTRNPRELRERKGLYDYTRLELCKFMGVPPGPERVAGGGLIVI